MVCTDDDKLVIWRSTLIDKKEFLEQRYKCKVTYATIKRSNDGIRKGIAEYLWIKKDISSISKNK